MGSERDLTREPCPDRIIGDFGGAFGMGCIGGFIWHGINGARNSPKGEKLTGAFYNARTRAPVLGGNFAIWGGTFGIFDCSFEYLRGKDDHWNSIASGFCTGGLLALRGGWRSASRNAVIGGLFLGLIEMVGALMSRNSLPTPRQQHQAQIMYEKSQNEGKNKHPSTTTLDQSNTTPGFF